MPDTKLRRKSIKTTGATSHFYGGGPFGSLVTACDDVFQRSELSARAATTLSNVRNPQHELRRHFPTFGILSTSCDDTFQRSELSARAATTLSNVRNSQHELRRHFPTVGTPSTSCDDAFQRLLLLNQLKTLKIQPII